MRLKFMLDEDIANYKKPSMFIGTISCGGKCCTEQNLPITVCQNDGWRQQDAIWISDDDLITRYLDNPLTSAIVFGGLEPMEQFSELYQFIYRLRGYYGCKDDIVIYTGYEKEEILGEISMLCMFENIICKYGRYIPNIKSRFDEVLGVTLASENQHAEKIS